VPEAIDHTDTARDESASGIAALVHGSAQTAAAVKPAKTASTPKLFIDGCRTIVPPIRKSEIGNRVKKDTEA